MKAFLDTSILVAAFYDEHEHHGPSFEVFLCQEKQTGCTAAHCLAEVYSVLTGMPGKNRATPDEALLFLGNVQERLTIVALNGDEYASALERAAVNGISGGGIYDAIAGECAKNSGAEAIYTWNLKHFNRLGADIAVRVRRP